MTDRVGQRTPQHARRGDRAARPLVLGPLLGLLLGGTACDALTGGDGEGGNGSADPGWNDPTEIVGDLDGATALGQNQGVLVWADEQGVIQGITKQGTERFTLAESGGAIPDLVVDGSMVFWLDGDYGRLWSAELEAGEPTLLAIALAQPRRIALDPTYVYWIDAAGSLMQLPRYGGTAWALATGAYDPSDLLVDVDRVFFTDRLAGTVRAARLDGGPTETLATGQDQPGSLTRDDKVLYWSTATGIVGLDLTKADASPVILGTGVSHADWLCVAGGYVYWSSAETGTVGRTAKSGDDNAPVASAQDAPAALAVDSQAVYWLNHGTEPGTGALLQATRRQ
jgi:hypothetical protein